MIVPMISKIPKGQSYEVASTRQFERNSMYIERKLHKNGNHVTKCELLGYTVYTDTPIHYFGHESGTEAQSNAKP